MKYPDADINDLGFYQQYELYKYISDITNEEPPVVDATDIRNDPEKILKLLCEKLDIAWDSRMLKWQKGIHDYDEYGQVTGITQFIHQIALFLKKIR